MCERFGVARDTSVWAPTVPVEGTVAPWRTWLEVNDWICMCGSPDFPHYPGKLAAFLNFVCRHFPEVYLVNKPYFNYSLLFSYLEAVLKEE